MLALSMDNEIERWLCRMCGVRDLGDEMRHQSISGFMRLFTSFTLKEEDIRGETYVVCDCFSNVVGKGGSWEALQKFLARV